MRQQDFVWVLQRVDPLNIELEHQNRFIREKNMNSAQFDQKTVFIGKLEAMNALKPIMILGDKETGRSSCATTIYDHYKREKSNYSTLFTPHRHRYLPDM